MLSSVIPAIAYGFAAAVTPGPLAIYLISQAMAAGWRRALPVAFSPLISDGPIAILVLAILSQVPSSSVELLRIPGGLFIFYLAHGAYRSWAANDATGPTSVNTGSDNLWKAAVVNWFNPNVYLSWSIVLGPIVLGGWKKSASMGLVPLLGFYVTMIGTMIAMVVLFATARKLAPGIRKSLTGISSVALAGLGTYQLWLGIAALIADS